MTRKTLLTSLEEKLRERKDGALDARLLLCHALKITHEELLAYPNKRVTFFQSIRARSFAKRRQRDEPIAYILRYREFHDREFFVNRNVLIPRPETETMIELALDDKQFNLIIDVGTGSGALAITLARETNTRVIATDISNRALGIARRNANRILCNKQKNTSVTFSYLRKSYTVDFRLGSLLSPITKSDLRDASRTLIIANLPYLTNDMLATSPDEVKKHEPHLALVSDNNDGLDMYRSLLKQICERRAEFGNELVMLFEIDDRQRDFVPNSAIREWRGLLTSPDSVEGFSPFVSIHNDLSGNARVVRVEL